MTNAEVGRRIGCTHSMASRLRGGKRLPSLALLTRIEEAFDVDHVTAMRAYNRGPESFGRMLTKAVKQAEATVAA